MRMTRKFCAEVEVMILMVQKVAGCICMKSIRILKVCLYIFLMATAASAPESLGVSAASASLSFEKTTPNKFKISQTSNAASLLEQGDTQFNTGNYGDAIETYTKVIESDRLNSSEVIQARLRRARAYVLASVVGSPGYDDSARSIGSAIADCSRVIQIAPDRPAGYYCRGLAYFYLGNRQEAFTDFNRAIEIAPNDPNAYYERGYAYYLANEPQKAINDLSRAIDLAPNASASLYFMRGNLYEMSEPQKAVADFNRAIELDPDNIQFYEARGGARYKAGEYEGAVNDFTRVIQAQPTNWFAYTDRGWAFVSTEKYQQALDDFNRAIELFPKEVYEVRGEGYGRTYYGRGLTRFKLGQTAKAIKDLQTAVEGFEAVLSSPPPSEYLQALDLLKKLQQ
jgi:tetratricopeptide (TPR) repeat protein